ncbi:MAG: hypothetical protein HRU22_14405 [Gammaproteobacteria bacterium]|nr:hypothetical protein [Gammaproteobacteria bacterium]
MFDRAEQHFTSTPRTLKWRLVHAIEFELGLLIPGVFVIAWWLRLYFSNPND